MLTLFIFLLLQGVVYLYLISDRSACPLRILSICHFFPLHYIAGKCWRDEFVQMVRLPLHVLQHVSWLYQPTCHSMTTLGVGKACDWSMWLSGGHSYPPIAIALVFYILYYTMQTNLGGQWWMCSWNICWLADNPGGKLMPSLMQCYWHSLMYDYIWSLNWNTSCMCMLTCCNLI